MKQIIISVILAVSLVLKSGQAQSAKSKEWCSLNDRLEFDSSVRVPTLADNYIIDLGAPEEQKDYSLDIWAFGYARSADKAYSCNGKWKVPLSQLFFCKSCFYLRESFADSQALVGDNPWVNVSLICPQVEFYEKGAHFGIEYAHDVDFRSHDIRIGARAYVPVKSIRIARRYSGQDAENEIGSIEDVRRLSTEVITGSQGSSTIDHSFAYRMDFLSSLAVNDQGTPLVDYTAVPLTMNDIDVTDNNNNPVNLINRSDGSAPPTPFAAINTNVATFQFLNADGTGLSNNDRGRFNQSINYNALSTDYTHQSQLWMVPTVYWDGSEYVLTADANSLRSVIENIVNGQIQSSVVDYLNAQGISLATQQMKGVGDISMELFLQWLWPDRDIWTELNCEFIFPSGKKCTNPFCVFCYPLGNNGHFEIGPGFDIGGQIVRWLSLNADFSYHFVLNGCENVAAPFCGATVKNIGPCVKAMISWQYLKLYLDVNIVEPKNHEFGLNAGYELYFKKRDRVSFYCSQVEDFEGTLQTLDPCLLSCFTQQISHKLRAEFFFNKSVGSIFGGFSYIVAGKNIPQESFWYVGFLINF
ncbi:TPA: hypothetical protein DIC20_00760 [Candidatus Dependentiae bacterium]|nr:hypothetical protein [Candidatus Dependentiae bacterium]HCU00217.1 hypothetical protein [Candidatus Dependentiae bacterium]